MAYRQTWRTSGLVAWLCLVQLSLAARLIDDCCCDADKIDIGNDAKVHETLTSLRAEKFFRIFKVDLYNECPFWHEDFLCENAGCSVCPCPEEDIPLPWKMERTDIVDRTLDDNFIGWEDHNEDLFIVQDQSEQMSFIDLQLNPEGYTGFEGEAAHRIWNAIYDENCFTGTLDTMCYEARVFYRLLSGIHAAISCHIAANYPLDPGFHSFEAYRGRVGPRLEVFDEKVSLHSDRLTNLYFAFVFLLRAVNKASPLLLSYDYHTGNSSTDARVRELIGELLQNSLVAECSAARSFDETQMFTVPDTLPLKRQFKEHFRNISRIMDCVGCEKCKLHGKLQILGMGTALKLVFADDRNLSPCELERNEVVALIVTLAKLSNAIKIVHQMEALREQSKQPFVADPCLCQP